MNPFVQRRSARMNNDGKERKLSLKIYSASQRGKTKLMVSGLVSLHLATICVRSDKRWVNFISFQSTAFNAARVAFVNDPISKSEQCLKGGVPLVGATHVSR